MSRHREAEPKHVRCHGKLRAACQRAVVRTREFRRFGHRWLQQGWGVDFLPLSGPADIADRLLKKLLLQMTSHRVTYRYQRWAPRPQCPNPKTLKPARGLARNTVKRLASRAKKPFQVLLVSTQPMF